jgi:hypothetical protein
MFVVVFKQNRKKKTKKRDQTGMHVKLRSLLITLKVMFMFNNLVRLAGHAACMTAMIYQAQDKVQ